MKRTNLFLVALCVLGLNLCAAEPTSSFASQKEERSLSAEEDLTIGLFGIVGIGAIGSLCLWTRIWFDAACQYGPDRVPLLLSLRLNLDMATLVASCVGIKMILDKKSREA